MSADDAPPQAVEQLDVAGVVRRIDEQLLDGPRRYTRREAADAAGLDVAEARRLWQALGFATVDDDERAFTDADVAALEQVRALGADMSIDDESMRAITRMLGRSFSRLASWQGQLLVDVLGRSPELLATEAELFGFLDRLLPAIENLHSYVWRRQLAAYLSRVTTNAAGPGGAETTLVVGFADMAQFTAFTRRSSEAELRVLLEAFETMTTEVVGECGGQIVKTIGDEILFVADSPQAGAEIALRLLDRADGHDELPQLRVGLAYGAVVSRLGDVFGQTVNIASRLTSVARAGSVLVDEQLAEALDGEPAFRLRSLRPTSVRGYQHLRRWVLRRASTD